MLERQKCSQYLTSIVSSIGALVAGLALGWTSPVVVEIQNGKLGFKVTDDEYAWVAGTLPLGAALACIPGGFLITMIGRKVTLCILPAISLIGWVIVEFAQNLWMLYAGRTVLGMACGVVCVATPVYIGEIAEKEIRGKCGNCFQFLVTIGVTLVYLLGAFLTVTPLNFFCMGVCMIEFLSMILMPESPTYLIEKGKETRAEKALKYLRGKNYDLRPELDATKADFDERRNAMLGKSPFAGFNNRACCRALYITLALMFFQQFSGISAVIFYSTTMVQDAGIILEPRFSAFIIVAIGSIMTLVSGLFVDKLGRRLLLMLSSAFMAGSTTVVGTYYYFHERDEESVRRLGWVPLVAFCILTMMFSFGYGPVPWIMIGELFAADVRGLAGSIAAASNWLFGFIVAKSYISFKNLIGEEFVFWIFSAISIVGLLFVLFLVPETKGKTLQEIQDILSGTKPATL